MQREKLLNFDEVWAPICECNQVSIESFYQCLRRLVAGRNELLFLRMSFQSSELLLLSNINRCKRTSERIPLFVWWEHNECHICIVFPFWRRSTSFFTFLLLTFICSENILNNQRLRFSHECFSTVTRKSRKVSHHFYSVQQVVMNLSNRKYHSVRTWKTN